MDAALKVMYALRKPSHLELAALKDPGSGNGNARETKSALGNRVLFVVKRRDEPTSEIRNFRESVRLAALVHRDNWGSFIHCERIGFKVPLRVGGSTGGFCFGKLKFTNVR